MCSFSKLIRMICVILSFQIEIVGSISTIQIGSNLVGLLVSESKSKSFVILVKKSAFNNWSYNRFKFEVTIRV